MSRDPHAPRKPTRARVALQLGGFAIGCALVAWCVQRAFTSGSDGLDKLRNADPTLVGLLLGSTLVSIVCSGFTFLALARPIRRFSAVEMQAVNLMASLFNYAPVRLGLALRCAFHWRVERMPAGDIAAWIAGVGIVTLGTIGSALSAGLVQIGLGRSALSLDLVWFATFGGCMVVGTLVTLQAGRIALLRKLLKGGERVLSSPRALSEGLAFRVLDLSMWGVRMWAAARIVGVELSAAQAVLLAAVAVLGAGNPLGRIGWREALVAFIAPHLMDPAISADEREALTSQMALLESAGEAALTIPLGILGAAWCLRAMKRVPSAR
ncbi:MAG: hypothetical protein RL325_1200 [Planctomycetota bacterium]